MLLGFSEVKKTFGNILWRVRMRNGLPLIRKNTKPKLKHRLLVSQRRKSKTVLRRREDVSTGTSLDLR